MLDLADIGEFSRHQAWWTVGRCGCGALSAYLVCRFVVAGENGVHECARSCFCLCDLVCCRARSGDRRRDKWHRAA